MAWYNADWNYRKPIVIDSTQVPGDLTNFPVLISFTDTDLAHTSAAGHVAESDGSDILFTASDGTTLLPHELEKYEHSTGELAAWVNVTSVSSAADTTIYVYYGNQYAESQEQQASTWDGDHHAVWHLCQDNSTHISQKDTATTDFPYILVQTGPDAFLVLLHTGAAEIDPAGKLVKCTYDPTTYAFGNFEDVYDDPTANYDARNPAGGMIDGKIYLFFARLDTGPNPDVWVDLGYITSADNGATWSGYTTVAIDGDLDIFSPYGAIVRVGSVLYQPYYGWDSGLTTYKVKLLQSNDGGATWSDGPTIYSGATQYDEASVCWLGGNDLVALARKDPSGVLRQFESTDGGATWSDGGDSNVGAAGGVNMGWIVREGERVTVFAGDRANTRLIVHENIAASILGAPTSWIGPYAQATSLGAGSGYPVALRWKPNKYVVIYGKYISASDIDMQGQIWSDRMLDSNSNLFATTVMVSPVAGQVDGAAEFSGSSPSFIDTAGTTAVLNFIQNTGIFTIESWAKLDDYTAATLQCICGNTPTSVEKGFFFGYENSGGVGTKELRLYIAKGVNGVPVIDSRSADNTIGDNNFHHLCVTGDATNVVFYVDGTSQAGSNTMVAKSSGDSTREVSVGRCRYSSAVFLWDGKLDEIRISDVARSAEWIEASYNNQSSPATFYTVGTQEIGYQPRHGVAMLGGLAMV